MLNEESIQRVDGARFSTKFRKPLYTDYAFASLPSTVSRLLTGQGNNPINPKALGGSCEQYDLVIFFLIDGFGWQFFERYAPKYPFLQRFIEQGVVSKISSQFPSTTAAHVTTLNTGLEVGQTGIYEWFYYEPLVQAMIAPLLFSFAGDHVPGTLSEKGIKPETLFPFHTIYEQLAQASVESHLFQPESIAHSPYSSKFCTGAKLHPYSNIPDAMQQILRVAKAPAKQPQYLIFYLGDIDAIGHRHGIGSKEFETAVERCWNSLEELFWKQLPKLKRKSALMITADHGMAPVDPKTTVYLNQLIPEITTYFKTNPQGRPLVPAGSCRDFFLHVHEEKSAQLQGLLSEKLKGIAEVYPTEELVAQGFFGSHPASARLKERLGNLLILPYYGESVWWWEKHRFEQHFFAAHGGLTPEELNSVLLFLDL